MKELYLERDDGMSFTRRKVIPDASPYGSPFVLETRLRDLQVLHLMGVQLDWELLARGVDSGAMRGLWQLVFEGHVARNRPSLGQIYRILKGNASTLEVLNVQDCAGEYSEES